MWFSSGARDARDSRARGCLTSSRRRIRPELIDGDGGLASAFGSDSFTFEDPSGDRASVATYFLLTLRKETGGKWLVAREFLIEDADTN
jgi:ketosteroid isomerase-like protein